MKLSSLASRLNLTLSGSDCDIHAIHTLADAEQGSLSVVLEAKHTSNASNTNASALIVYKHLPSLNIPQLVSDHPKKSLAEAIQLLHPAPDNSISKKPIADSANISDTASLAPFIVIGDNSHIDTNTTIASHVHIGTNCHIGKNVTIYPNVTIYDNCSIGDHCIIHAGAVIGSDGFGYYKDDQDWKKMPHIGAVDIEAHVEIGANCTIDKGCLGKTHIKTGCKLDNLVHIAHNCIIDAHCAIAAQVGMTGSSHIEEHVMVGGQVGIDSCKIGKHSIITAKAGITKDVPEKSIYSGFPGWEHKKELKKEAVIRRLSERRK